MNLAEPQQGVAMTALARRCEAFCAAVALGEHVSVRSVSTGAILHGPGPKWRGRHPRDADPENRG
jgi:hypothetical protein